MKRILFFGILAGASLALTGCFPNVGCDMGAESSSSDGGTSSSTDGGTSASGPNKVCLEMGGPLAGTVMDQICKSPNTTRDTGCDAATADADRSSVALSRPSTFTRHFPYPGPLGAQRRNPAPA